MCGIAGIYNFKSAEAPRRELVEQMTDVLRHRGPDDRGFFATGPVALGMRRLSIIDLEGGAQPIGNEDGSVQVVCNGEIYNHRDLRRELESKGHRFRSRSDVEVIVHGYEEFGVEVLQKLNGMFSFALWDAASRRLFLARDRMGIKPLYYAETSAGLVFASELKALLLVPEVRRDLDPVALRQYFTWEYIPAPRTPFVGVQKVQPATFLLIDHSGVRSSVYWRLQNLPPLSDLNEATEGLRSHLMRSVRLQMEADVPVGAFLSGGLDSSAIVACLKESGKSSIHTFSIGFPEQDFNEIEHARHVAEFLGTSHRDEILQPRCLDLIQEVAGFLDEPFADNSILPTFLVSRLAREQVKVVLSGDGGDELFGGYDHYKADRIASWYARLPAGARRLLLTHLGNGDDGGHRKRGSWRRRMRRLEEALSLPADLEHARWMVRTSTAMVHADLIQEDGRAGELDPTLEPWTDSFRHSPFEERLSRQLEVDVKTFLVDDILFKVDRASMAVSLEARVPYLDHELVEYAFRIPERWKLRWLEGKWILRKAFRGRLPRRVLHRRKSGFSVPVAAWLRGDLRTLASDLLSSSRLQRQGILRVGAVDKLLHDHLNGSTDNGRALWALIMFQLWSERSAGWKSVTPAASRDRDTVPSALFGGRRDGLTGSGRVHDRGGRI